MPIISAAATEGRESGAWLESLGHYLAVFSVLTYVLTISRMFTP
jgi:hypothetical protein